MTTKTLHKATAPALVKVAGDGELEEGSFKAVVATYDTDSVGDRILPGAFEKSLARWAESGNRIPVIWSHDWTDPFSHIGEVVEASEDQEKGLVIEGRLDLDEPKAAKVYKLMKGRRVNQFSFAYDILDASPAKADGADVLELRELELFEVGPCLVGVNRQTELLDIKGKKAVASHSTDTVDREWDAAAVVRGLPAEATASDYRTVYGWNDPGGDADTQSAWRFPHHHGIGGPANVRAAIAGVAALNGARGGSSIPDSDRRGVHAHLARHLRDADVDVPPLKSLSPARWRRVLELSAGRL